jgi:hypothetical protein
MKFEEVMSAFRVGKKVRRRAWDKGDYLTEFGSLPMNSIVADDWEIVKEKVKKTVWVNVYQTAHGEIFIGAGHWNSQSKAMEHASNEYNTYLGAHPITVEVDE